MTTGFTHRHIPCGEVEIAAWVGGSGPPVLLLHGFPQTHAMWHRVATRLATQFTVVLTDLRGYGSSSKPRGSETHVEYSKRAMAADQVAVMSALGFDRFAVVGHDRGGRVGHRLALDHRERVTRLAVLDIVPTLEVFRTTDEHLARVYYHWFFLAQPAPLPETLIGADPEFYLRWCLKAWTADPDCYAPDAMAEYVRAYVDPATVHATCEDYRAGASIDLEHDEADLADPLTCPVLVLWGAKGFVAKRYDVLQVWRRRATDVRGHAIDTAHFLPEEDPAGTYEAVRDFLSR
ncbi:MAG: alpha/beta fold hydrolase [Sporichthyaceae bacterium]